MEAFPKEFCDNLAKESEHLGDIVYLDNAGAAIYPKSIVQNFHEDLLKGKLLLIHIAKNFCYSFFRSHCKPSYQQHNQVQNQ